MNQQTHRDPFAEYPLLENENIIIRKLDHSDAGALAELTGNEKAYRTLPTFLYELKYEDKAEVIAKMDEECFRTRESILLGVFSKHTAGSDLQAEDPKAGGTRRIDGLDGRPRLIGIAEIYNYEENKAKASIGYRLSDAVWGRGIATQVCQLLRDYLVEDLGLRTITAHILRANPASARSAAKAGFEGKYLGLWEDWGYDALMLTDKYVFKREWKDDSAQKLPPVRVEQFVMAYLIEQDRIRALLPEGFASLRPVLRINTEIRNDSVVYVEFNTPVEADGRRGWLNIANWKSTNDPVTFFREDGTVTITAPFLALSYRGTGASKGCPAERDNEGCYYLGNDREFRPAEKIDADREQCSCSFRWRFHEGDASGESDGTMAPAHPVPQKVVYPAGKLSGESAAAIPCRQILGAYVVRFDRWYGLKESSGMV